MFNRLILILTFCVTLSHSMDQQAQLGQNLDRAIYGLTKEQAERLAQSTSQINQGLPPLIQNLSQVFLRDMATNPLLPFLKSLTTLVMWKFTLDRLEYYKALSRQLIEMNRLLVAKLSHHPVPNQPKAAQSPPGITPPALSGFWGNCGRGLVSIGNVCLNLGQGWLEQTRKTNLSIKERLIHLLQQQFRINLTKANQIITDAEQQIDPSIRYIAILADEVLAQPGITADTILDQMRRADARRSQEKEQDDRTDNSRYPTEPQAPIFSPVTPLDIPDPPVQQKQDHHEDDSFARHAYTANDQFTHGIPYRMND